VSTDDEILKRKKKKEEEQKLDISRCRVPKTQTFRKVSPSMRGNAFNAITPYTLPKRAVLLVHNTAKSFTTFLPT